MDRSLAAMIVLSAAGREKGHLLDVDPQPLAATIVGDAAVEAAGDSLGREWLDSGGRIIQDGDEHWPAGLRSLGGAAPLLLWVRGELPSEAQRIVAMVGSRACSPYGRRVARTLAGAVAECGSTVVSGGATGIDASAHRGALQAGGSTVVVAAGGAGRVYPSEHGELFAAAERTGAVVWEHPPGARMPRAGFLRRNRLIAAMAGTTVLIEAAERSGALNTGRTAADLGRLVLGVPGPIDAPTSAGVHRAIADGWAALLLGAADLCQMATPQR
jgi:DNA processing protein